MKCFSWIGGVILLLASHVGHAESFTIENIEVIGAKKISVGTVLNYLPVNVGETFDIEGSSEVIRELYSTGFFLNIVLLREENNLVIKVQERPSIAEVNIEGNKDIDDETLTKAMEQIGLAKGRIFNELQLNRLELELQELYYSLGKYAIKLKVDWRKLDDDRIAIDIDVSEGKPAVIRSINITGNNQFDDKTLLRNFELETADSGVFANDKYSSSKLTADIENLKSFYLDRGYIRFEVESKQVTISPDKRDINITINITEGDQYTIQDIDITGDLVVEKDELMALVLFREGEFFSRKKVSQAVTLIRSRLGEEGYAFAEVQTIPEVNNQDNTVRLKLLVIPGKKMIVRFVNFIGNDRTRDYVLRREMRQLEGELYRESKVNRSRTRLQRLDYITSVNIVTKPVPRESNLVDLEITVAERFSGNFQVGLGYSQNQGALLNIGLTHDNVFGTGKSIGITFDNSPATERYGFSYQNPYFTEDGVSRGFNFNYSKTDASRENVSNYLIDRLSLSMNFGIPLSEYNQLRIDFGVIQNDITVSDSTSDEIYDFLINNIDEYDSSTDTATINGAKFDSLFSSISFSKDTRNRRVFADTGALNSIKLELFGGDLDFYKVRYLHQSAFPVVDRVTLTFKGRIGVGDSYNKTIDLPFFEKFTAGGVRSVRGYERNSLGPQDSKQQPFGGNFQVITSAELLFPFESLGSSETFRLGLYFDAGNVFVNENAYDSSVLRQSVGISAKWFSVIGPLEFSYAEPLNNEPGDDTRNFQFALGASF